MASGVEVTQLLEMAKAGTYFLRIVFVLFRTIVRLFIFSRMEYNYQISLRNKKSLLFDPVFSNWVSFLKLGQFYQISVNESLLIALEIQRVVRPSAFFWKIESQCLFSVYLRSLTLFRLSLGYDSIF